MNTSTRNGLPRTRVPHPAPVIAPPAPPSLPGAIPVRREKERGEPIRYPALNYHADVRDLRLPNARANDCWRPARAFCPTPS